MAIDTINRWQLVRDVIVQKRSGAIVVQTGKNYLHWILERGNLICISSSFPEASLTNTVQEQQKLDPRELARAQNLVDQNKTFGAVLLHQHLLNRETLQKLVWQHWNACTDYLFEPSMHLFWSTNSIAIKSDLIRYDRPFCEVLLQVPRSSITIPSALRTVQQLKPPFRLASRMPDLTSFTEEERRIWMYLQSGNGLKQILQDREVARIPCYKTLFLLWVSGYLGDSQVTTTAKVTKATTSAIRRIPAEWIFPLCAGALIGVFLAPSDPPKEIPRPAARIEPLDQSLEKPAWSTSESTDEESDTKAQRHKDETQ